MKKLLLALLLCCVPAFAQFVPTPVAGYVNSGSGWAPLTTTSTTGMALNFTPKAVGLYAYNATLGQFVYWDGGTSGGGSATVSGPAALFTCSGTNTIACVTTQAAAGAVWGNFTGATAAPAYSTTPAFNGVNITGINFTQIAGTASIAQLPATVVQSVGTVTSGNILKWVTSNTATNSVLVDNGTSVSTNVPVIAPSFAGSAVSMTNIPVGQIGNTGALVSPITSGLIGEYHLTETSAASPAIDSSGLGNNGTYFGTPTFGGGVAGGITSAGQGGMDYPASFNSTALTISVYTCSAALGIPNTSTFPILVGGLNTATAPTNSNVQAFGFMMLSNNATTFPGFPGKYANAATSFNSGSILTIAGQTTDGCHLNTWKRNSANDQFYIDGKEVVNYRQRPTGSAAVVPTIGPFSLGMPHYATLPTAAYAYPYPIYYSAVFNRALSDTEIGTLAGSVQTYAALRGITKIQNTFSDPGNQLLFVGDSITFGYLTTTPWPRTVTTAGNLNNTYISVLSFPLNNIASSSWQLEDMINECQSRGYGSLNPNSNSTVIIWGGTNETQPTAVTYQVTYARLRRLVQCYKGATPNVPRVFVATMISRGISGVANAALDLFKNNLNDLIRQDNAGADGTIDVASFPGLGKDGSSANPTAACNAANCFNVDAVHPIDAGAAIIASGFEGYINWADAKNNWQNPTLITTGATYQELAKDVAINTNPVAVQTITLPAIMSGAAPSFLVGTDRYVKNLSAFVVTINPAAGEVIDGNAAGTGISCAPLAKCTFRAVLGATAGLPNTADATSGAHWEQQ